MLNTMMSPYYAIVYFAVQFLLALLAASCPHRGLRRDCGNNHRIARADLYPVSCLRQAGLAVLGWLKAYLGFSFYKVVAAATRMFCLMF